MNELQTIREALGKLYAENAIVIGPALSALDILEAREAELPDTAKLIERIREPRIFDLSIGPDYKMTSARAAAAIGQYAYRYSEDIRKDRDYWQKTAMAFHDAVHQHIENHKGELVECGGEAPAVKVQ